MGQLDKSHMIEAGIWSLIVAIFFGYTFEFNQPIEIYKFGATGWPRVIILLLLLVTLGNLLHQFRNGSAIQKGRVGIAETDEAPTDYTNPATLAKIIAILLAVAPLVFPALLNALGLLTGVIQAYIFAVLATVYISAGSRPSRDEPEPQPL